MYSNMTVIHILYIFTAFIVFVVVISQPYICFEFVNNSMSAESNLEFKKSQKLYSPQSEANLSQFPLCLMHRTPTKPTFAAFIHYLFTTAERKAITKRIMCFLKI